MKTEIRTKLDEITIKYIESQGTAFNWKRAARAIHDLAVEELGTEEISLGDAANSLARMMEAPFESRPLIETLPTALPLGDGMFRRIEDCKLGAIIEYSEKGPVEVLRPCSCCGGKGEHAS